MVCILQPYTTFCKELLLLLADHTSTRKYGDASGSLETAKPPERPQGAQWGGEHQGHGAKVKGPMLFAFERVKEGQGESRGAPSRAMGFRLCP